MASEMDLKWTGKASKNVSYKRSLDITFSGFFDGPKIGVK